MSHAASTNMGKAAAAALPGLFVLLWATGFIGARLTMPYAEPMTFLGLRFVLAATVLAIVAAALSIPRPRALHHQAVAGLLIQFGYLGGVFVAVRLGLEAGASALIVGAQPILTAALAGPLLGERVTMRQWAGLALGGVGVVLVVSEKLGEGLGTPAAVAFCVGALVAISIGTIYQKRFCAGDPPVTGAIVQYVASALACGVLAFALESREIAWSASFVFGLAWLALVLSCGAVLLLFVLLQRGTASKVAGLFFLVPCVTALIAYALFGEVLGPYAVAGTVLVAVGVALISRPRPLALPRAGAAT